MTIKRKLFVILLQEGKTFLQFYYNSESQKVKWFYLTFCFFFTYENYWCIIEAVEKRSASIKFQEVYI